MQKIELHLMDLPSNLPLDVPVTVTLGVNNDALVLSVIPKKLPSSQGVVGYAVVDGVDDVLRLGGLVASNVPVPVSVDNAEGTVVLKQVDQDVGVDVPDDVARLVLEMAWVVSGSGVDSERVLHGSTNQA